MLHDAIASIRVEEPGCVVTQVALYADDALLASQRQTNLQIMLNVVVEEGRKHGLELNRGR